LQESSITTDMQHQPTHCLFLKEVARKHGADAACLVPATKLVIKEELARLCGPDNPCPSYGLAPSCPPHTMAPSAFRELVAQCLWAVVFKKDVAMELLLGPQRRQVVRQIHQICAAIEHAATSRLHCPAHGYAAGSCKDVFCLHTDACVVLAHALPCPHAHLTHPSLSAVGIDFQALAALAGWPYSLQGIVDPTSGQTLGLMAGLVLIEKVSE
jgi:predicted metal-binding protein